MQKRIYSRVLISRNFSQALYYTGNRSVALATNWIFDHPELDLETPLEEEMRRLEAEEEEAFDDEDEEGLFSF